jgi:hypothetical protein
LWKGAKLALPSDATQALQSQYDTATGNFATGYQSLMDTQNQQEGDTYNNLQTQYNVPGLQSQITGFQNAVTSGQAALNKLPTDVAARDKGTLTDQAQLDRQTTAEGIPIQQQINAAGIAEAPLQNSLTAANNNITQQMTLLNDKFAREATGYTTANQATLNALLDKLNNQRTLDAAEMDQANKLALQNASYNQQLAIANATNQSNITAANIMAGNTGTGNSTPSVMGVSRIGNSNQVSYGGGTFSRENLANQILLDNGVKDNTNRNNPVWQSVYKQILQQFPDVSQPQAKTSASVSSNGTNKLVGGSFYTPPTSLIPNIKW